MPRFSERKKRELRAEELRVILDPAGHEGYKAELARLEQWLALDDELTAGTATARKRGRPKGRRRGSADRAVPKRKRGRPKGSKNVPAVPAAPKRKRGRPKKVSA
jgi:hypothetical protein